MYTLTATFEGSTKRKIGNLLLQMYQIVGAVRMKSALSKRYHIMQSDSTKNQKAIS
jgi:hypothetical protein